MRGTARLCGSRSFSKDEHAPTLEPLERYRERAQLAFDCAFDVLLHTRTAGARELLDLWSLFEGNGQVTRADLGDRARSPGYPPGYFLGAARFIGPVRPSRSTRALASTAGSSTSA